MTRCEVCTVQLSAEVARCSGLDVPMLDFCHRHGQEHQESCPHVRRGEATVEFVGVDPGREETSREYEAAGGYQMTREQAVRHFDNRALKLKREILALPLPEKFRLVADFLEQGDKVPAGVALSLARRAVEELEKNP